MSSAKESKGRGARGLIPLVGIGTKFLLFNAIWCSYTTFTPFSHWEMYVSALIATLVLGLPYRLTRRMAVAVVVMCLMDVWMVCNLMYYRTYFTAIPPTSYLIAGNLEDFMPAVAGSLRWCDALFPLSTVLFVLITNYKLQITIGGRASLPDHDSARTNYGRARMPNLLTQKLKWSYLALLLLLCMALGISLKGRGGFMKVYGDLQASAHWYACGTPLYTLFGTLCYNLADNQPELTDGEAAEIEEWLAQQPALAGTAVAEERDNCIVIFVESFESWVLGLSFEGQEITPRLNSLLRDSTTLYAPKVYTQVGGGRSIDAQLLVLAGLMPLQSGAYSTRYPDNSYFALPKAMKELKGTRSYLLTVDKAKTWNQAKVAHAFGIDSILSYPDFRLEEAFGNRKRLGDRAFFAQCKEKMERGEVWPVGEKAFVQMVTYSGHSPFKMPDELKELHFTATVPEMMADYMNLAHYTDEAIGQFVDYVKSRPDYRRTMIVITGDHEGLADNRKALAQSTAGKGVVADREFTPLIVLNAPLQMRYDGVMGQIDIYPTLLNLLGLERYPWSGMGQSILDPKKPAVAVNLRRKVEGDTLTVSHEQLQHLLQAPAVSDRIIRFNLLKRDTLP